ncbi:MAG: hypothetical protein COT73_01055 [Bdellovibrio sp. CG10_big_fil_rev_8_21_14_0_10_47_8]|nr:MAG: hypothetical protein COT73_01055 [Bdellovibrio sp. CG10_big_fil_rev_8_21_14_0_10_47_8]
MKKKIPVVHNIHHKDATKVHPILRQYLGYCLIKNANIVKFRLDQAFHAMDMATPHLGILTVLEAEDAINQNKLGDELGIDKASMVKLLDQLEKLKLVQRVGCKKDRRVKYIQITTAGKSKLKVARKIAQEHEDLFLAPLNKQEKALIKTMLNRLLISDQS